MKNFTSARSIIDLDICIKITIFNTKPIIFNTKPIIFNTKSIIFNTKPIIFNTKSIIFYTKPIIFNTKPIDFTTRIHQLHQSQINQNRCTGRDRSAPPTLRNFSFALKMMNVVVKIRCRWAHNSVGDTTKSGIALKKKRSNDSEKHATTSLREDGCANKCS